MLFKKPAPPAQKKSLTSILDFHLNRYARAYTINRHMMTMLLGMALLVSADNYFFKDKEGTSGNDHIAVIKLTGEISATNKSGSASQFAKSFDKAVSNAHTKAVLILANSGGGSPVMSEGINAVIRDHLANREQMAKSGTDKEKALANIKVYVSVEDLCASACLASIASADVITAHKNSLVGSIGVRMDSFGIDGLLAKLGVERQVLISGTNKDLLDPYRTMSADEKAFIKRELMDPLHRNFIDLMKEARGNKLDVSNPQLFTGMVWSGTDAMKIGLVDAVQTTNQLEKELMAKYGVDDIQVVQKESFSVMNMLKSAISDGIAMSTERVLTKEIAEIR